MEDKIIEAISLLSSNGYVVKKITKRMEEDMIECEESDFAKECFDCACSVCIMQ